MGSSPVITLRDYQTAAIESLRAQIRAGVRRLLLVSGTGCHAPGQYLLMFDGSLRKVEDVQAGDALMGPDSTPRHVLSLCRGIGNMVRIVPVKGSPFVVNDDHVLTLVRNHGSKAGSIVDVSVRDYLAWTPFYRGIHKLFRVPAAFENRDDLPIEPYFLGVVLGDGTLNGVLSVCKPDVEIHREMQHQAEVWGINLRVDGPPHRAASYHLSNGMCGGAVNPVMAAFEALGLRWKTSADKFVPQIYKVASREARLELLAGLMDTDGCLSSGGYDYVSKSEQLANDVAFLARSLGLAAYCSPCEKYCQNGGGGRYYRVSISGHTSMVPCRIPRKQAPARRQVKDVLRTGFSVEPVGIGEFFGFTLSGDGRYLLDDFTVTHNTGKTVIAAAIIGGARQRDKRILFLAHRRELIEQTSRKLDAIGVDHGICQASHWRTRPWLPVQVASIQTLINRELPFAPDLIIIDETHRARAGSYQDILARYPNAVSLGLTATPVRSDGKGLGTMFDVMVQCPSVRAMIDRGFLVPIRAWTQPEQSFKGVRKTAGDYNLEDLAVRMDQAKLVGNIVRHWKKLAFGRQTVVFAVNVEHSKHICKEFTMAGVLAEHLDGTTPTAERDAILDRLATGRTRVVCNCQVLSEGWDQPVVSCVVLARPTLSAGLYLQMAGRALRPSDGKTDCILLDHAGCVRAHGLVDEDREWTLTADKIFNKKSISTADTIQVCPKCMAVAALNVLVCPECGYVFARRKPREVKEEDGDLVEATPEVVSEGQMRQRRRQYEFFLHQQEYGTRKDGSKFARGYAEARYRGQYKQWPPVAWRNEWKARERQEGVA